MPRNTHNLRQMKKSIIVFSEGESERAYSRSLKKKFQSKNAIDPYDQCSNDFEKFRRVLLKGKYKDKLSEINELWFFFDTEEDDESRMEKWKKLCKVVNEIHVKNRRIIIRLLMTKGCVEYWYLLHFEKQAPSLRSREDKDAITTKLENYVLGYQKGSEINTDQIINHIENAIINGKWSMNRIEIEGTFSESDCLNDRNRHLFFSDETFTIIQEAVETIIH